MLTNQQQDYFNILKRVISLSWPVFLAFIMQKSYHIIDIYWVGKLGATAIAAVALAGNVFYIILAVGQTLGSGTIALVAHSFGARLFERADNVIKQSLLLASIIALLVSIAGIIFTEQIMMLLGGTGDVLLLSTGYLRIVFIGFFFQLLSISINYAFRGAGDMVTPMLIMFAATLVNIVLDPLFIFGIGFFPKLGVQGAAIATVIAKCVSFLFGFLILIRGRSGIRLKVFEKWFIETRVIRTILRVGVPLGISYGLMGLSVMSVFRIVASFSEYALAAVGIGNHILQLASLPIVVSIGVATTTLVGQSFGARDLKRAVRTGIVSIIISTVIMIIFSAVFYLNAQSLMSFFTQDMHVISFGIEFMHIVSLYLPLVAVTVSLTGVFRGAGDTLPPMFAGLFKLALIWILALFLSKSMGIGVKGVWLAMFIAYGIETVIIIVWYRLGKWRKRGLELLDHIKTVASKQ